MDSRTKQPINVAAGHNLRLILDARRMRQNELAKAAKVSPSTINLILKGERGMSKTSQTAIASVLRVHPSIFDLETELNPEKVEALLAFQQLLSLPESDPRYTAIISMVKVISKQLPPTPHT